MKRILSPLFLLAGLSACSVERSEKAAPTRSPNDWLLSAEDDATRYKLLQQQLRGFDQPMWEVGERFELMHTALGRGNFPLAAYHWEKIRTAIENGIAKRPARAANAKSLFLQPVWSEVDAEIRSADPRRAWAGFERAKGACRTCHTAENVAYMNDQPLFDLAGPATTAQR